MGLSKTVLARVIGAAFARNPLRTIATTNRINFDAAGSAGKTAVVVKWPVLIASDATSVVMSLDGWYMSATGEVEVANGYTVEKLALVVGSTVTPITFDGGRTKAVATGAVKVLSDEITVALTKGSIGWIKARLSVATAGQVIPHSARDTREYAGSQAQWFDPAVTTVSDTDLSGNYTFSGTNWTTAFVGPCPILLGRPTSDALAVLAVGDSIVEGVGDDYTLSGIGGKGFVQRATVDGSGNNNPIPCLNFGRATTRTEHYIGTNTRWQSYLQYARIAISEHGTNDIGSGGTGVLSTIQSNLTTLWAALRAGGIQKIVATHLLCRAFTSDNFQSLEGQTVLTGWTEGGKSEQQNTWLTAQVGTLIDTVVDTSVVRDSGVPQKWFVTGAVRYSTTDGTHPSAVQHGNLAQTALRPALLALLALTI